MNLMDYSGVFSCPICGAPVDKDGNDVPIPENYDAFDYTDGQPCDGCKQALAYQEYKDDLLWYHQRMAEDDSY